MVTVRLWPDGRKICVEKGTKLSQALIDMGIDLKVDCGQHGRCGKCQVFLEEKEGKTKILACTYPVLDDVTVLWPKNPDEKETETNDFEQENRAGKQEKRISYTAAAVDLGTTTVAVSLLDYESGEELGYEKRLNPQRVYGADVISRMEYALESAGHMKQLCALIRQEIYQMLQKIMNQNGADEKKLLSVVVAGNPVMTHIFCGVDLQGLSRAPFSSMLKDGFWETLPRLDMERFSNAHCYVPPTLGGHVGSDFYACIIAKQLLQSPQAVLMMDIGTNGELGICQDGMITVTSTAAGPAFEGAGIRQGMTAVKGAIKKASWNPDTKHWDTVVVGGGEARGLSGSGLVDVAAGLLSSGQMDDTGYLKENPVRITGTGMRGVRLWQEDIRSLQMAKSAIRSGAAALMEEKKIIPDVVMLCGDFANALDQSNAKKIGLLPELSCPVEICGNQALAGAGKLCRLSKEEQEALWQKAQQKIRHMELADSPFFEKEFIRNMDFS
ncbi:MAG: ASKHA domain-containing protein [Clostridiales bacterium]|nr:ASKHA domain-containing protein [Clostridiales bacterium]